MRASARLYGQHQPEPAVVSVGPCSACIVTLAFAEFAKKKTKKKTNKKKIAQGVLVNMAYEDTAPELVQKEKKKTKRRGFIIRQALVPFNK